jgi:hypothetical protein
MKMKLNNLLVILNKMRNHNFNELTDKQVFKLFIKNNLIINKIIFKESKKFSRIDFRQYFFYSLISFVFSNLKNRRVSFILFYMLIINNQFYKIIKALYSYSKIVINNKNKIINKKSIISFGFPAHSFNLSQDKYNSYGDFLNLKFKNFSIFSINEYANKNTIINKNLDDLKKIKSKKRNQLFFKFSLILFMSNLSELLKNYVSIRKKMNLLIAIEFLIFKLKESYLNNLLKYFFQENISIKEIHFLPFNNLTPKNIISNVKIRSFFFADSISIMPIYNFKNYNNFNFFFKYIPFNNFTLGESCYGRNISKNIVSNILKKKLLFPENNSLKKKFIYCNLGFTADKNCKQYKKKYLVLLDNPPKKNINIFGEYVSLNPLENFSFYKNFFLEIAEASKYLKIKVLFKPKYMVNNIYYSNDYYLFLEEIKKSFNNIDIIDPYAKISLLINAAKMSVSYPYSTSLRLFKSHKVKSFYYIPSDFIFLKNYMTCNETIYGTSELKNILFNNF